MAGAHIPPQAPSDAIADLGYARVDLEREARTGDPEVVYGAGKEPKQIITILRQLQSAHPHRAVLATRLSDEAMRQVRAAIPEVEIDDVARCGILGPFPTPRGRVTVVAAGTSDLPVAREAATAACVFGAAVSEISDVGVAGLHRLMAVQDQLLDTDCLVVVAGMDGALPSVVGGLSGVPLVAVPTSVGYGASFGGIAALLTMLNACAPGVTVVNIDNGFGAGVFAARVARRSNAGHQQAALAVPRDESDVEATTPASPEAAAPSPLSAEPTRPVQVASDGQLGQSPATAS